MNELYNKLIAVPDSYFGFVLGIMAYAKKSPKGHHRVLEFINNTEGLNTSDIVKFVMDQPDFLECGDAMQMTG